MADDDEAGWQEVPIPADCQMGFFADQVLLTLRSDWALGAGGGAVAVAGSLLAANVADVVAHGANAKFTVLFTPSARVSLSGYTKTKNFLIVSTLENVKSRLRFWSYTPTKRGDLSSCEWKDGGAEETAVIRGASVAAVDSRENDFYWFTTSSFTTPRCLLARGGAHCAPCVTHAFLILSPPPHVFAVSSTLSLGNAMSGPAGVAQAKRLKALPPQFDASGLVEAQYEATSKVPLTRLEMPPLPLYRLKSRHTNPPGGPVHDALFSATAAV